MFNFTWKSVDKKHNTQIKVTFSIRHANKETRGVTDRTSEITLFFLTNHSCKINNAATAHPNVRATCNSRKGKQQSWRNKTSNLSKVDDDVGKHLPPWLRPRQRIQKAHCWSTFFLLFSTFVCFFYIYLVLQHRYWHFLFFSMINQEENYIVSIAL